MEEGERHPTANGAAPEQKRGQAGAAENMKAHNGIGIHPSEEQGAPLSLAASQVQSVINSPNGLFFSLKIEHAPPTSSLNKSLAPVLFSSRSPGSAAFSQACQYFTT